jgi:hypothetical protein
MSSPGNPPTASGLLSPARCLPWFISFYRKGSEFSFYCQSHIEVSRQ